ncbi:MAG: tetratricopeptide repeat protein [Thermodesulfobacteriota bacterium]
MGKGWIFAVGLATVTIFLVTSAVLLAQPRPMTEDVYTPIAKGYDLLAQGKYEAAQDQFEKALKKDRYNSFALNNLAALYEKQGKMKEAMAFLNDAIKYAGDYQQKVTQTCFVEGLCTAARPVKETGPTSTILPIVRENIKRLREKAAKMPEKPVPAEIKPMAPPPPAPKE